MKTSQTRACCNHGWERWRLARGAHDFMQVMLDPLQRAKPCQALRIMCAGCMKRHIRLFTQCAARSTGSCPMRTTDCRGLGIDAGDNDSAHHDHEERDNHSQEAQQDTMFSGSSWGCTIRKAVALSGAFSRSISMNHRCNEASMPLVHSHSTFRRPDRSAPRS